MTVRIALWLCAGGPLITPAVAQNFSNTFFFGDSNSDSGRYLYLPEIIAGSLATGGAYTTNPGPEWTVALGQRFGIVVTPSDAPGGGNNFAAGDARVSFEDPTTNAWSATSQINAYLALNGGRADPNALYSVWIGENDLKTTTTGGFGNIVSPPNFADITTLGLETVNLVNTLAAAGARYILIPNSISIQTAAAGAASGFGFGTGTVNSRDSRAFYDQTVWNGVAARGINFIPADINTVYNYVLLNPAQFGITNTSVLTPACGATLAQNCTPADYVTPNAASTYFYADTAGHVTSAVQQIEADYFYSLIVAPSQISFLAEAPVKTQLALVNTIQNQIPLSASQNPDAAYNAWVSGDISWLKEDNYTGFPGDPGTPAALTAGFDFRRFGWLFGAAFSIGTTQQSFGDNAGGFRENEASISGYAAYIGGPLWFDTIASFGYLDYHVNRDVPLGISVQDNSATTDGSDISLASEIGYKFSNSAFTHGPIAGMILQRIYVDGFTEASGITALSFDDQIRNSAVSELGYQVSYDAGQLRPYAKLVWNHELASTDRSVTASLTTIAAPSFSLPAVVLGKDWGTATLGAEVPISDRVKGYAAFTSEFAQNSTNFYSAQVGLNVSFGAVAKADMTVKAARMY
ncbi:MAG TPA: autotransporter domain-containing protein [Xanthobacteraceae bacterium]